MKPKIKTIIAFSLLFHLLLYVCHSFSQDYDETGKASFYADKFQGRNTTSGEKYDKLLFTAAHRTLPFNTLVKVTNLKNNKSVIVRINDRGPNTGNRLIDLSYIAAKELDMIAYGVLTVRVQYVGMANSDSVSSALESIKNVKNQLKNKPNNIAANENISGLISGKYYNGEMEECQPKGYGIMTGVFYDLENCFSKLHEYEAKYFAPAYVYVYYAGSTNNYMLIVGRCGTLESAINLKERISQDNSDIYIIKYKKIN